MSSIFLKKYPFHLGTSYARTLTHFRVTFHFKSSKKSNNGTDVNAGQIPQILYRLMTSDQSNVGMKPKQQVEPTYLLTNDFISNFSPVSTFPILN
jgi:hypothetical protein